MLHRKGVYVCPMTCAVFKRMHFRKCSCWRAKVLYLTNLREDNIDAFAIGGVSCRVAKASKIPKGNLTHPGIAFCLSESDVCLLESRCGDIRTPCRGNCIYCYESAEDERQEGACKMVQLPAQLKNI